MSIHMCGCASEKIRETPYAACDSIVSHEGAVLDTFEINGYNDSDFCAVVWDEEAQAVRTVEYASTRGWTYHNSAKVDAAPENITKALAWYRARLVNVRIEDAHAEAREVRIGSKVRSLTTRGKNKGVAGVVKWKGDNGYGETVGVQVEGEKGYRFIAADRVELTEIPEVDEDAIRASVAVAEPHNWRSAHYALMGRLARV